MVFGFSFSYTTLVPITRPLVYCSLTIFALLDYIS